MTTNARISAAHPYSRTWISRWISGLAAALGTASLIAAATPVFAQAQVQASQETCANLKNLVQRQGRVVIGTGPYLYDTYVNNCPPRASQVPAYLSTRDNPQCFVGYSCGQGNN